MLRRHGVESFAIVEQADDIGGTWHYHTYPGVACDTPSPSYQFSFEQNPHWSRSCAPGPEIKAYLQHCVDKYGVRPHLRLGSQVVAADFDEDNHCWRVQLADGEALTARHLIAAPGAFTVPKPPEVPGLADFRGKQIPDPDLRHRLTSYYPFGCKRPAITNRYLPAFRRDNVELVTDPIERITPAGVRTRDGREYQVDTLILATGYKLWEMFENENSPWPVRGMGGLELRRFWYDNRIQAYQGCTVPGFPNAFLVPGPYGGLTGTSYYGAVEAQAEHAVRCILEANRRGATYVAVKPEANAEYFRAALDRRTGQIFYHNDCSRAYSYYYDRHGDVPIFRASTTIAAQRHTRRVDFDAYEFRTPPTGGARRRRGNKRSAEIA